MATFWKSYKFTPKQEIGGTALSRFPDFSSLKQPVFTLACSGNDVYRDNLCFFRDVICAREMKILPQNFRQQLIKQADVKNLYATLQTSVPELPYDQHFRGFYLTQLDTACQKIWNNRVHFWLRDHKRRTKMWSWLSQLAQQICWMWHPFKHAKVQWAFDVHKKLKTLFKEYECGICKRCFKQSSDLDRHKKICDGTLIKHVWKGSVYDPKAGIKNV